MIKYPYSAWMRPNFTDSFLVNWMIANDDALNLPFPTLFGSSRFDSPDKLPIDRLGEVYELHPPFYSGKVQPWINGSHICGTQGQWQNGWPPGTPGLPVDEDGVPLCCGTKPAAFTTGFDLGFDS